MLLITATVTLASPSATVAQAPGASPPSSPAVVPADKSPNMALALAAIGTGASWAVLFYGSSTDRGALAGTGLMAVLVAPSLGHFYAGETGSGLLHTGLRAGGFGASVVGMAWLAVDSLSGHEEEEGGTNPAPLVIVGGALLSVGASIYSIYDAPRAVRRHNSRARSLVVTPAPMTGPDRSTGFGLHLGSRF